MNRKNLPLLLMLAAGTVTCVINLIRQYPMLDQLIILFIVLLAFYLLGCVLMWTLDLFDKQNEERFSEEGEVIEKDTEQSVGEHAPQSALQSALQSAGQSAHQNTVGDRDE